MPLEDMSPEQLTALAEQFVTIAYIMVVCMWLYFFGRVIPAFLQYKAIKYLEVRINIKKEVQSEQPLIAKMWKKYQDKKKQKDEYLPLKMKSSWKNR